MFRCSARCCENSTASMQQVQQCIERCHAPLAQAQAIVTGELERFQVRSNTTTVQSRVHGSSGGLPEPADPPLLCPLAPMQDRLSRCTLHCNDKAKDALEAGGTEARVRAQLDACVATCGDDHLRLIPAMAKKMKDSLAALRQ